MFCSTFNARIHPHPYSLIPSSPCLSILFLYPCLLYVLSLVIKQEFTLKLNLSPFNTSISLSSYVLSRFLMQEYTLILTLSPFITSSIPLSLSILLCFVPLFNARIYPRPYSLTLHYLFHSFILICPSLFCPTFNARIHPYPKFLTLQHLLHSRSVERLSQQVE